MTKSKNKVAAAKVVAALSPEEFLALSPEEQGAYLKDLQAKNSELEAQLQAKSEEPAVEEFPSFEVDEDEDNDIEGGTYVAVVKNFIYEEQNYESKKLIADLKGDDKKKKAKAELILGKLVSMKSGVLARKED